MDVMNKRKWRLQSHEKLWLKQTYKTSSQLEVWGETEVITSKISGIEVSISKNSKRLCFPFERYGYL